MKIKQTIFTLALFMSVITGLAAQSNIAAADCGGATTSIINCSQTGSGTTTKENGVYAILILVLKIMTAGIGILAVGGIAYGAVLYASSGDKPEQAKKGMDFIRNVVIGLIAYGLMFVLLNFLIPGGVFAV